MLAAYACPEVSSTVAATSGETEELHSSGRSKLTADKPILRRPLGELGSGKPASSGSSLPSSLGGQALAPPSLSPLSIYKDPPPQLEHNPPACRTPHASFDEKGGVKVDLQHDLTIACAGSTDLGLAASRFLTSALPRTMGGREGGEGLSLATELAVLSMRSMTSGGRGEGSKRTAAAAERLWEWSEERRDDGERSMLDVEEEMHRSLGERARVEAELVLSLPAASLPGERQRAIARQVLRELESMPPLPHPVSGGRKAPLNPLAESERLALNPLTERGVGPLKPLVESEKGVKPHSLVAGQPSARGDAEERRARVASCAVAVEASMARLRSVAGGKEAGAEAQAMLRRAEAAHLSFVQAVEKVEAEVRELQVLSAWALSHMRATYVQAAALLKSVARLAREGKADGAAKCPLLFIASPLHVSPAFCPLLLAVAFVGSSSIYDAPTYSSSTLRGFLHISYSLFGSSSSNVASNCML